MKVLMINGSPYKDGCTFTALNEVGQVLAKHGIESEILYLGLKPVAGCIACMKCFKTGHCFMDDQVRVIRADCPSFPPLSSVLPYITARPPGRSPHFASACFFAKRRKWPESWARRWCPAGAAAPPRLLSS